MILKGIVFHTRRLRKRISLNDTVDIVPFIFVRKTLATPFKLHEV